MFCHMLDCKHGAECKLIEEKDHISLFRHPSRCASAGLCADTSSSHRKSFVHPPECKHGMNCLNLNDSKHQLDFCHFQQPCPQGMIYPLIVREREI